MSLVVSAAPAADH